MASSKTDEPAPELEAASSPPAGQVGVAQLLLSSDVLVEVLQYVDIDAVACAGVTCQRWLAVFRSNALWEALYKREFPISMHRKLVQRIRDDGLGAGPASWLREYRETPRPKFRGFYFCRQWLVPGGAALRAAWVHTQSLGCGWHGCTRMPLARWSDNASSGDRFPFLAVCNVQLDILSRPFLTGVRLGVLFFNRYMRKGDDSWVEKTNQVYQEHVPTSHGIKTIATPR
jgi:hypothetical protein